MSDHIPFHILEEILERLPVKLLIKFRSVSKSWRSSIDSSHFVAAHSRRRHTQPEHLLINYREHCRPGNLMCLDFVDDDTFPQHKFVQTLPLCINQPILFPRIIGNSHGLLCVEMGASKVLLWNPSIKKLIPIQLPPSTSSFFLIFGVCPITVDPKIVNIRNMGHWCEKKNKVMLYTLSSGEWRNLSINNNLQSKKITHTGPGPQVIIDRFIYWSAYYPGTPHFHNVIMSFDMTNESFEVIHLPHITIACDPYNNRLPVSKLGESLIIFESSRNTENQSVFVVWMMEHGDVQRLFTKLYTIEAQHESVMKVVGFSKSASPIMEVKK